MRWRILPLMMVFVALAHFNRLSISVAGAERIIGPGSVSATRMGVVYSTWLALYTLFMIPGGWLIDRAGPRVAWMVVGFGSAAGAALTGLVGLAFTDAARLWLGLLLVRSLMGMVNAPLHPCGARLAANWVPPGGVALANGLVTGAACVGMASTYVVFGWLIDLFDWPRAFLVSAGVTLAVAAVWSVLGADHPPGAAPPRGRAGPPPYAAGEFVALLANRSLLCLTGSYAALGYFQYLFFYWAQFYFEQERRLSKDESRLNSSLLTLAMAAGMVAGGWLSDWGVARLGTRRGLALVPVGGFLLGAVVTVVGALAEAPAVVLASFALAMAAVGSSEGAFWTTAVRLGGRHGGTAAGVLNCGGNAGGLVAPVLTPLLSELFGWKAGLMAAAVVCVAGAALWAGVTATEDAAAPGAYRKDLL